MRENVVAVTNLSRRFGSKTVLNDVSLDAPRGSVFGLVGENGAGKTTLIKHILGLLRAEAGSVRVFGINPVADPVSVLGRIGYLSEQPDLPGWMRVDELMRYTQAFYPRWDAAYAEEMRKQFRPRFSRTNQDAFKANAREAGLLAAKPIVRICCCWMSQARAWIIVRSDILAAVIRTVADERPHRVFLHTYWKRSNVFPDHIAMLHQGKLVLCGPLDEIKAQHRRITLRFDTQQPKPSRFPGL
jgi:ABC-2 type transport system ATP-binding protein